MKKNNLSVLGAGFACLDIVRNPQKNLVMLGGTAANVLTILSLLGLKTEFLTTNYYGESEKFIKNAFEIRGVKCVPFANTKNQIPRIIERLEKEIHFFSTICPKCGKNLVKCNMPTLDQIKRIDKCYNNSPNIFFYDRLSEGIRECAIQNKEGWNVYEPNSCRMYSNLIGGIKVANIVKYSEDRISAKITDKIISDIGDTNVILLIITMGEKGIKYIYRTETGKFSKWNYIKAVPINNVIDSSGAGDWLTAIFLYFLLKEYPNYTRFLKKQYIEKILLEAQKYASQNCSFVGAQGMLRESHVVDKINLELNAKIKIIRDPEINWEYNCDYCFTENIKR